MTAFIIILTFMFITGLVIGSFLNVVILRTVSGESIVFPASHCPKCGTPLKWYHNIPLLSYFFLGGKCAFCKEVISFQYPLVEFLTGLIFVWFGYLYFGSIMNDAMGSSFAYILMLVFSLIAACLFIVISGTDILEMKVSDAHTYLLIGTGVLYGLIIGGILYYQGAQIGKVKVMSFMAPVICTVVSSLIAFLFMEILRRGANYLLKTETFGDGDSFIFAGVISVLMAMFGGDNIQYLVTMFLSVFFFSVILAVIFTLPSYIKKLAEAKNRYLLGLLTAFIIYACAYFYANTQNWLNNIVLLILSTLILFALGIGLCFELLKNIRKNQTQMNMIPFGPALTTSGFVALVVLPIILGLI